MKILVELLKNPEKAQIQLVEELGESKQNISDALRHLQDEGIVLRRSGRIPNTKPGTRSWANICYLNPTVEGLRKLCVKIKSDYFWWWEIKSLLMTSEYYKKLLRELPSYFDQVIRDKKLPKPNEMERELLLVGLKNSWSILDRVLHSNLSQVFNYYRGLLERRKKKDIEWQIKHYGSPNKKQIEYISKMVDEQSKCVWGTIFRIDLDKDLALGRALNSKEVEEAIEKSIKEPSEKYTEYFNKLMKEEMKKFTTKSSSPKKGIFS